MKYELVLYIVSFYVNYYSQCSKAIIFMAIMISKTRKADQFCH
jgi:hypothetical protein